MFPNFDNGRFSVMDDGTLVIESVQRDDAGEYICKGLSVAGSAYAKARLDVRGETFCFILSVGLVAPWPSKINTRLHITDDCCKFEGSNPSRPTLCLKINL